MIDRIVKLHFRTDAIDQFKGIFEESKLKIRQFPGNQGVRLLQDANDPCIFFTHSLWDSENDLNNYRHSALFKATWAKTKILFNAKPEAWSNNEIDKAP